MKNIYSIIFIAIIFTACNSITEQRNEKRADTSLAYVPQWTANAVWYQIFVERFRNGDKTNDPTKEDIKGADPEYIPDNWKTTPWEQDWYKEDDWFVNSKETNKWFNLQQRRYGGDLQGVIDKLDYLSELGINAVYFNPLNDSPSLHKYDPRYWHHIDRNFGPSPAKDIELINFEDPLNPETWTWTGADKLFLKVIEECHKRNIKVVLDYSFNHTGREFWAFKDVQKNGVNSKTADWYKIDKFDDPKSKVNEFSYIGWSNVSSLPEIKKDVEGQNKEMPFEGNIHSRSAKQHIFSVAKRWLDPNNDGKFNDGVDGYRLDVAAEIPLGFWREFRKEVKKTNPEAYLIGEIWWKKWPNELMNPNVFLKGDIFDAIMNYRWYKPARHYFADAPDKMLPSIFESELNEKLQGIDSSRNRAMMNLISSHDVPRVSSSIYNHFPYKFKEKPGDSLAFKINKPDDLNTNLILKMLLIQQFTYIGAPHIYYGDEVGMWGADDPDCRKPMIWSDIKYENETTHPLGIARKTDIVKADIDLFNFYKKLIEIRKNNPVFVYGNIEYQIDDKENTFAYIRKLNKTEAIVIFNKSDQIKTIKVKVSSNKDFVDLLSNKTFVVKNNYIEIDINSLNGTILMCK